MTDKLSFFPSFFKILRDKQKQIFLFFNTFVSDKSLKNRKFCFFAYFRRVRRGGHFGVSHDQQKLVPGP